MIRRTVFLMLILLSALFFGCVKEDLSGNLKAIELDRAVHKGEYAYVIEESLSYLRDHQEAYLVWNQLGWAYLKLDNLKEGEVAFLRALEINPEWDNAYVGLGVTYRALGDYEKSRMYYLKAIEILPENAEALSSLLVIELIEGDIEEAIKYGEKAWSLRKDLDSIPANLSVAYHYKGDLEKRDYYYSEAKRLGYINLEKLKQIFNSELTIP